MIEKKDSKLESDQNDPRERLHTFTPINRRRDGALFRKIRERIREGYYDSNHILREVAGRIAGCVKK